MKTESKPEQQRLYSYPASLSLNILAHTAEEATETLKLLVQNLARFDDMTGVEGEME